MPDQPLKSLKEVSTSELATHNKEGDCWVAVSGKVYDVTTWFDKHPGGKDILLVCAGRDVTNAFSSYHPFSDKPQMILGKYEIGSLVGTEWLDFQPDSGFYKEVREKVGAYFKSNDINYRSPVPGLLRLLSMMPIAALSFYLTFGPMQIPLMARLLSAVVFGVFQVLPLMHLTHDSSHMSFGTNSNYWLIGRILMDFYAGASMTSWNYQHVVGHHLYTNLVQIDPDLPSNLDGDVRRVVDKQRFSGMYKYQWIYLPILYGTLGMKIRFQDVFETFLSKKNGVISVNPLSRLAWAEMIISKLFFVTWRMYIPLVSWSFLDHHSLSLLLTLLVIVELVNGWYLAFNFQVSHISTECEFPYGSQANAASSKEWAVLQVTSSVDYDHGTFLTAYFSCALNYQIVHHLFPSVSQYRYPEIAPIVRAVCKKHDIHYAILPSFKAAFLAHVRHLYLLGQKGEAAEIHMG